LPQIMREHLSQDALATPNEMDVPERRTRASTGPTYNHVTEELP